MWPLFRVFAILVACAFASGSVSAAGVPVKVLLLSGSNNHDWRTTTPAIAGVIEGAGLAVRVEDQVAQMTAASLDGVSVVVSNFNTFGQENPGPVWSPEMRAAFLDFIRRGGGFVGVHAGGSVFYDWPEFQSLCGGWWGPQTGHGAKHEAEVTVLAVDHPITRGLPAFRTHDEFWQCTSRSPGAVALAQVIPDPVHGGSGRPEPILLVTTTGQGRGVGLLLGHDAEAMQNPGFQRLLVRSVIWAATGQTDSATSTREVTPP
jgi:type 1 glutamine amidotransferase